MGVGLGRAGGACASGDPAIIIVNVRVDVSLSASRIRECHAYFC